MNGLENERELGYVRENKWEEAETDAVFSFTCWRRYTGKFKEPAVSTECHTLLASSSGQLTEPRITGC